MKNKYIRTKDGRVESWNPNKKDLDMVEYLSQFTNYQGDYAVIAQADTIEELVDEFVVEFYDEIDILRHKFVLGNRIHIEQEKYFLDGGNVYGAIWTNKGLIYVAKMNDKGELELI